LYLQALRKELGRNRMPEVTKTELWTVGAIIIILVLIVMTAVGCGHKLTGGEITQVSSRAGYYMTTMCGKVPIMTWYPPTYRVLVCGVTPMGDVAAEWFSVNKNVFDNKRVGDTILFNED